MSERTTVSDRPREPVSLAMDPLLDDAKKATGLSDFGFGRYGDFRADFTALLAAYDGAMKLTERGRRATRRRMLGLLINRLRVVEALKKDPAIHTRALKKPLFLTGLPRTGTSALFNLLASDPSARPLLLWEGNHPDPIEVPPGQEDPRLVALRDALARAREANPGFAAIHDAQADKPEECVQLLAHSMAFVQQGVEPLFPPYAESFLAQDFRPMYALYADLLRLLDAQRPGERWILKTPAHLWALDSVLAEFPDATLVVTHRDPRECIPSYCSMVKSLLIDSTDVDPLTIGPRVLDNLAESMRRAMRVRDSADPARFVDVAYVDFVADPLAAAERIHAQAGLPWDARVTDAMKVHIAAHPQNKHGKHEYALAEYGLTEAMLRDALGPYLERHRIAMG